MFSEAALRGFAAAYTAEKNGENDTVFIVRNNIDKDEKFERFADILASEITAKSMDYKKSNDHPACTGWNQPSSSFACVMCQRPECEIAFTLESAYFGAEKNKASADRFVELGRAFAKTILRFTESSPGIFL